MTAIDTGANYVKDKSATSQIALRKAAHNILYTTVNSRAYAPENLNVGMMGWQIVLLVIDIIILALAVFLAIVAWKKFAIRRGIEMNTEMEAVAEFLADVETEETDDE